MVEFVYGHPNRDRAQVQEPVVLFLLCTALLLGHVDPEFRAHQQLGTVGLGQGRFPIRLDHHLHYLGHPVGAVATRRILARTG